MSDTPYEPISCEFHDVLEALATRRGAVAVVFLDDAGERQQVHDAITDLGAQDHAEYMTLRGGLRIRLDRIVSVDGVALADFKL